MINPCGPPLEVRVTAVPENPGPLEPPEVGNGGEREVRVVARRVGLKRFDDP